MQRKVSAFFLIVFLSCSAFYFMVDQALAEVSELEGLEYSHGIVQVSTVLNVREGPGNNYPVEGQVKDYARVEIEGQTSNGWYKINVGNISGYVWNSYIVLVDLPDQDYGYVDTGTLNVREGPSASNKRMGTVSRGEQLEIVGKIGNWYKIKLDNVEGPAYVSRSYVSFSVPLNDVTYDHGIVQVSTVLNVREGPGNKYSVKGQVNDYTRAEIEGQTSNGWYKINVGNISGYVWRSYIVPVDLPDQDYGYVDTGTLNVRGGPSASNKRVGTVSRGERLDILGKIGNWYKIKLDDVEGPTYVSRSYVTHIDPFHLEKIGYDHGVVQVSSLLNVRGGPGNDYAVAGQVEDYARVEIEGQTSNGWYKINVGNMSGYVWKNYIVPVDLPRQDQGYVDTGTLNVRSGPSASYDQVSQLNRGAHVELVGEVNGWYKIKLDEVEGPTYVSGSYIQPIIGYGVVQVNSSLNVREGPGNGYPVKGGLAGYTRVVLEDQQPNGWFKVNAGDVSGYVWNSYIVPVDLPNQDYGYVDTGTLNVRSGPSASYDQVHQLNRGARVEIVGKINSWYKIKLDNVSGPTYVGASYISKDNPINPIKIFIDPGHGGSDPGATANGLREKDIALHVSLKAAEVLEQEYTGVDVRLSRSTDIYYKLDERTDMANDWGADYFVSIHSNAGGGTGFESFIHPVRSYSTNKQLQEKVHTYIAGKLDVRDRGMKDANFAVLRETNMPAILLELLFVDHHSDAAKLSNPNYLDQLGRITAEAIAHAWDLEKK